MTFAGMGPSVPVQNSSIKISRRLVLHNNVPCSYGSSGTVWINRHWMWTRWIASRIIYNTWGIFGWVSSWTDVRLTHLLHKFVLVWPHQVKDHVNETARSVTKYGLSKEKEPWVGHCGYTSFLSGGGNWSEKALQVISSLIDADRRAYGSCCNMHDATREMGDEKEGLSCAVTLRVHHPFGRSSPSLCAGVPTANTSSPWQLAGRVS